jgi:hypothetical protein
MMTAQSAQRLATGWTAKGSDFESLGGKILLLSMSPISVLEPTQPPALWVLGVFLLK